jgi:microcin C transport system substrate-binding protein
MREYIFYLKCLIIVFSLFSFGCSQKKEKVNLNTKPVSIKQFDTPPGADPSVSAEKGGNGFKGEGWTTNDKYNVIGKKEAVKGGRFNVSFTEFPASLRVYGKDSNFELNIIFGELLYETLLNIDPHNKTLLPGLATHWKIENDSLTFRFRINPDARWADGMPVTAYDVLATYNLLTDSTIQEPFTSSFYLTFEKPVIESKYIFTLKSKEKNWRQFYYAANFSILPEHILKNLSGKTILSNTSLSI